MADQAQLEVLSGALDSALRARAAVEGGDLSFTAVTAEVRTVNRLIDAAVDCGMSYCEADHIGWASQRVATWLCSAGADA